MSREGRLVFGLQADYRLMDKKVDKQLEKEVDRNLDEKVDQHLNEKA